MSAQQWLQAELRLLFQYGEHQDFEKSARRILAGLVEFDSIRPTVSLVDALDQAGVDYTTVQFTDEEPTCPRVMWDGAQCGYDLVNGGGVCEHGHKQ